MNIDVLMQKYLTQKVTEEEKEELLGKLVRLYNDLLLWIEETKKRYEKTR